MAHVQATVGDHRAGLSVQAPEIERTKYTFIKAGVGALVHPLAFSKTLYKLGFEPKQFPAKQLKWIPRRAASRPLETFRYVGSVRDTFGWRRMYSGAATGFAGSLVAGFTTQWAEKYMDTYFKDVGGDVESLEGREEVDLTHHESFRVHFRHALRRSITSTVGATVAHPFAVLMVREILQIIQTDQKCSRFFLPGLLRIGDEEGLSGLFAGLIPSLLANFVCVWAMFGISFAVNRLLITFEKRSGDVDERNAIKQVRTTVPYLVPFVAHSLSYAHEVDSVIASVVGQLKFEH